MPVIPNVPVNSIDFGEHLQQMDDESDWLDDWPVPVVSVDLIMEFLAHAHAFTAVGLEAQGLVFSSSEAGDVKYLYIMPQINEVCSVQNLDGPISELDAVQQFSSMEPQHDEWVIRCWIHTHPRHKAFMSESDIFQLYSYARTNRKSFGIVISPKEEGIKVLCVHLTRYRFENI